MIVGGLMSGTSADGIDVAIVNIRGTGHRLTVTLKGFHAQPYPRTIRQRVLDAATRGRVDEICHLHVLLGELFANAALNAIADAGLTPRRVRLLGSHGQTLHHRPIPTHERGVGPIRSTLQIGDPAVIAERTGIPTIADFRARDLAAGGEGAPLTPYAHFLQFARASRTRLIVNLGGIANVTILPRGRNLADVRAFDTGPCNMLLDGIVERLSNGSRTYDAGGRTARRGHVHPKLLNRLLAHPYFSRTPPKSTGREAFGAVYVSRIVRSMQRLGLSEADGLATVCRSIARALSDSRQWMTEDIHEVILGGGGVYNNTLVTELQQAFAPIPVYTMDERGSHSKAFEAMAFAVMAYQTYHGVCSNVPSVTGARHPVILGSRVPGTRRRT